MKYDKLVRDKIPEILESKGKKATFRTLNEEEFKEYLEKKLDEEVAEFHKSKSIEELADIFAVLEALSDVYATFDDMIWEHGAKSIARGGFDKRICLVEIEDEEKGKNTVFTTQAIITADMLSLDGEEREDA